MNLGAFRVKLALKHIEILLRVLWPASTCFAWHRVAIPMKACQYVHCSRIALRDRRAPCDANSSSFGPIPSNTTSPIGPFHFRHLRYLAVPST
jgi:hypothetical protein